VPRQQTLTASMQWSHNLLDAEERVFFRRLAVFPGTFDVDAAAAVCLEQRPGHQPGSLSDPSIEDALWRIGSLVDKSLIVARPVGGEVRYRLLDTVRQYAASQLAAAEETERCRDRHLDHYLAVAEAARLPLEMDQDDQRIRLAADRANLQAALDWGLTRADPERGRRLAAAMARFWFITGDAHQGLATLQTAIARAPEEQARLQARLWTGLAMLGMISGRFTISEHAAAQGKALAAQCGDDLSLARCLAVDAYRWFLFDFARSRELARAASQAAEKADDPFVRDWALVQQAYTFTDQDHHDAAVRLGRQALVQSRPRSDRFTASYARAVELWSEMTAGRLAAAVEIGRDAVDLAAPAGDFFALGTHTLQLAMVLGLTGDLAGAQRLMEPVARAFESTPDVDMVGLMVVAGNLHLWAGDLPQAAAWLTRGLNFAAPQVDNWATTRATPGLAKALRLLERIGEARAVVDRGVRLARSFDGATILAQALDEQAHLTVADDSTEAERLHHEALTIRLERGLRLYQPDSLDALAGCAARAGDYRDAARLLAASDVARRQMGYPRPPVDAAAHDAIWSAIRAGLPPDAVAAATAEGATLTLDEAVGYARRGRGPRDRNARGWTGLSPTELTVARHVARGLTNRDIAAQMLVSLSTVKTHLTHIFIKLDVTNRTELTRVVLEHDEPPHQSLH
jgi:DNA-binding NarL/FixJ family response regulator